MIKALRVLFQFLFFPGLLMDAAVAECFLPVLKLCGTVQASVYGVGVVKATPRCECRGALQYLEIGDWLQRNAATHRVTIQKTFGELVFLAI